MIILACALSVLYWIVSALINSFLLYKGNFSKELFYPDLTELWVRSPAILFVIAACIYSHLIYLKRKRIEGELIKRHEFSPAMLDNINSLVVIFDSMGRILRFNNVCEQMSGYLFDEVREKHFWKLFLDDNDADTVKTYLTNLDKNDFPSAHETNWITKDGRRRLIKWSNTTIFDRKNKAKQVVSIGIDITAHLYTEEVLKRSEEEYKNIVDNIGIGVSLISADLKIIYANNQMRKWFGDSYSLKTSLCHDIFSNFSKKRCSFCTSCKSLDDGNVHETTMKALVNEKEYIFKVISFPVKNKQGRVIAAIETIEDFTKIDKQEEEIRHGYLTQAVINSLLRFSLENISFEGFLKCALTVILSSPFFSSLATGALFFVEEDSEVLIMKIQSKVPEAVQKKYKKVTFGEHSCGVAASSGDIQFVDAEKNKQRLKEDPARSFGHYCVPIIYSGNILGVIDVYLSKDHKRDKKEEDFLHAAANSLAGVVQRKKAENKLSQVNKCFINLGIEPTDNIQRLVELCSYILGASAAFYNRLDLVNNKFHSFAKYNAPSYYVDTFEADNTLCFDAIKKTKDEALLTYGLPLSSYAKADPYVKRYGAKVFIGQAVKCRGQYVGVVCAIYNNELILGAEDKKFLSIVASAISIEEERIRANEELNETCEKLEEAQYGLVQSEKLTALGRFSSGIAHEVKNPLGIILGGIEFLERKIQTDDPVIVTAMKKIKESTLRADSIVRNLLKFAMPSEIIKERIKPDELVNDTLSLLKYRVPLINLKIRNEFSKEEIYVEVDKNQLGQVLFNVLMNAIEAMPKGGPIRIKTYKTVIKDFLKGNPASVIEIIDKGEGISEENLSKLFEPFFTTKRDKKGTGLGLAMSRMIVANHKGILTVDSELKKGTTVKIILPAA